MTRRQETGGEKAPAASQQITLAKWFWRWLSRSEACLATIGAIAIGTLCSYQLWGHFSQFCGLGDWDFWFALQWVPYKTIVHFHQFPVWNPYKCGGMPMLGNPQSHFLTPWFLLTLIFGPFIGLRLEIPIYIAIAWSGAYVLARAAGTRATGALAAAFLFATSSWFYVRVTAGVLAMCGFAYLPWAMAGCWIAAGQHHRRYAAICGAFLALSFLECGPYPAVYGLVGIGVLMLAVALLDWTAYPLQIAISAGLFTLGFASVKLVPAMLLAAAHGRPTGGELEVNTFQVLWEGLFSPVQNLFRGSSNGWGFWETSAYIGAFWIPALLAANTPRRVAPWFITAAVTYALAQGDGGFLWPLAHRLPVLSSLRLPSRFLIIFVLMVGMIAAWGLDWLSGLWSPYGFFAAIGLLGACTFSTGRIGPPRLSDVINNGWVPGTTAREFTQISRGPDNNSMIIPALENHGVTNCYEYVDWPTNARGADERGYRGEQYLLGRGTVALTRWTPNALTFRVNTPAPTVLVVNQNYDRSWKLVEGTGSVIDQGGLIGVRLPAGIERVKLAYRDWSVALGALISLATVALAVLIARRELKSERTLRAASP